MIIYLDSMMRNSEAKNIPDSLGNYYASNRATAIINYNNIIKIFHKTEKLEECLRTTKINWL